MAKTAIVMADAAIPFGARVLVRGRRASIVQADLANATVVSRPSWLNETEIAPGHTFSVVLDEGLGGRSLQALADGPIMDPSEIYLPAGKISMEEFRARQRSIILEARP